MILIDLPGMSPAKCIVCGCGHNADGRKFVDIEVSVKFYGRIYICTHCVSEAGHSFGMISKEEYEAHLATLSRQGAQIVEIGYENERLRTALSLLDFLGSDRADDLGPGEGPAADETASAGTAEPESVGDGDSPGESEGESGPVESADVGGSDNVRDDDPLGGIELGL